MKREEGDPLWTISMVTWNIIGSLPAAGRRRRPVEEGFRSTFLSCSGVRLKPINTGMKNWTESRYFLQGVDHCLALHFVFTASDKGCPLQELYFYGKIPRVSPRDGRD